MKKIIVALVIILSCGPSFAEDLVYVCYTKYNNQSLILFIDLDSIESRNTHNSSYVVAKNIFVQNGNPPVRRVIIVSAYNKDDMQMQNLFIQDGDGKFSYDFNPKRYMSIPAGSPAYDEWNIVMKYYREHLRK
jgi:hypothetical protein